VRKLGVGGITGLRLESTPGTISEKEEEFWRGTEQKELRKRGIALVVMIIPIKKYRYIRGWGWGVGKYTLCFFRVASD